MQLISSGSVQLLPRHFEYFANLRRVSDRPWVTAHKHVLHGPRSDRIVVLRPHSYVAQSGRLPESFDQLCHRHRGISILCPEGFCDHRLLRSVD